mgnify:CR=1 FL=1
MNAPPLLIGLGTLARLRRAENLLDPAVMVKVPRAEVRWLVARSIALVLSDRRLSTWVGRLAAAASAR